MLLEHPLLKHVWTSLVNNLCGCSSLPVRSSVRYRAFVPFLLGTGQTRIVAPSIAVLACLLQASLDSAEDSLLGLKERFTNFRQALAPRVMKIRPSRFRHTRLCILTMYNSKASIPAPLIYVHRRVRQKTSKTLCVNVYGRISAIY